jgi:hypothetical protein
MTSPWFTTTRKFVCDIVALNSPFSAEERAVLLARAEASINKSERAMLLRMPCPDKIH